MPSAGGCSAANEAATSESRRLAIVHERRALSRRLIRIGLLVLILVVIAGWLVQEFVVNGGG
ncbi:hypothetical protein EV191_10283 [Tamaricihabitans halophyticus]|uniref:Uncharacterized protein n=1 Tax=Tamaricihabitans halophyticus TaxID=1262583 RepID=A0A4R2QZQ3_9PSEU|nr:hypothetical protein EV191_10283 [Tamaricihabitans halophyticus]